MAECSKPKKDVIHCSICYEIFKIPKYLPCLHTFCQLCLQKHIRVTSGFTGDKKTFKCPMCRAVVHAPDDLVDTKDWASKIPTNHLIVTLIDNEQLTHQDKPCDSCSLLGEKRKAISWCTECSDALCDTCKKCHETNKMSSHHNLLSTEEMNWISTDQFCEKHPDKKLERFCVDHDEVCCLTCVTTYHKTCHQIRALEDAAKDSQDSSDLEQICTKMSDVFQDFGKLLENRKKNLTSTDTDATKLSEEIKTVRQEIQKDLESKESHLLKDLEIQHLQTTREIKDEIRDLESRQQTIDEYRKILNVCKKQPQNIRVFIEKKKAQKTFKEQEAFLHSVDLKDITYRLRVNEKVKTFQTHFTSLGTIAVEKAVNGITNKSPLKDCNAVNISSFDIRQNCTITGAVFVNESLLALVSLNYPAILLYDCRGNFQREILLSENPFDITVVDKYMIVTFNRKTKLTIIHINTMQILRTISFSDECRGISSFGEIIVVNCYPTLNFIEPNGTLIGRFGVKGDTHYIAASQHAQGTIYCSYMSPVCVKAFDITGKTIFRYNSTDLDNPVGLATDREGNMYIPGYQSHNIHQITPDGEFIKIILNIGHGIKHPRVVSFDKTSDRFLVAHSGSRIKIFQMTK